MTSELTSRLSDSNNLIATVLGYLPVQTTLLVMHHGFNIAMPWWVVWFPTVMYAWLIAGLLAIALVVAVVAAFVK